MNTESGTVKGEAEGPPEKLEVFRCVGFWGGGGGGKGGEGRGDGRRDGCMVLDLRKI
jgi:hypothetical protein